MKDGSFHADIFILDKTERIPRKLNVGEGEASVPSWSHDGKWIYFTSGGQGGSRIFRVAPEGGRPTAISTSGGYGAKESADGQYVFFASSASSPTNLLRASLNPIGTESLVEGMPGLSFAGNWTVVRDGIYFYPADDFSTLSYLDFASKKVQPILKGQQVFFGISVSPDGRYIVYARHTTPTRDVMLIDNFRWVP
jgi:Tol biopolymer transport system component